ncbi:MAG: aminopeptidase P family protein [Anaerovoracaceae bacterium]|jgi:Xaa-Pro aminopeptidase
MREQLIKLRRVMKESGIDCCFIPSGDDHNSEYVSDHFKCREFISGFTGSAGVLVVTQDRALLWTDGRYFLQAASQLEGSGFELMKIGEPGVPTVLEFLTDLASNAPYTLGFDGRVVSADTGRLFENELVPLGVSIRWDQDLPGKIWEDRPSVPVTEVWQLPPESAGRTAEEKLADVRHAMKKENADALLITDLTETAWLLNLRASDIANTPVFYSFALITESRAELYIYNKKEFDSRHAADLPFWETFPYEEIYRSVSRLPAGSRVILDPDSACVALLKAIPEDADLSLSASPIQLMKAVKNKSEIAATRAAHIRDGVAMVRFLMWLKDAVRSMPLTEIAASDHLDKERLSFERCFDLSFPTIAGYEENGAIIHYQATPETDAPLAPKGFLLVDSGGQYLDGTTDITRTIVLGPLTGKQQEYYTYVLKSHIALASAVFPRGTTGLDLDRIARRPLREHGLDFNHGTGHGIGHVLSVHEGPNIISLRGSGQEFLPGMITSDEPGVYLEREFGIRLENEILCVEKGDRLGFEPLTLCPFDRAAILPEFLTNDEREWLNRYHRHVNDTLSPYLTEKEAAWLKRETLPI